MNRNQLSAARPTIQMTVISASLMVHCSVSEAACRECAGWAFWGRPGVAAHAVEHFQDAGWFPGRSDGAIAACCLRDGALALPCCAGALRRPRAQPLERGF